MKMKTYKGFSNEDIFLFIDTIKFENDKNKKLKYKRIFWGFIISLILFLITIVTLIINLNP
jgi:hypothetical protein